MTLSAGSIADLSGINPRLVGTGGTVRYDKLCKSSMETRPTKAVSWRVDHNLTDRVTKDRF